MLKKALSKFRFLILALLLLLAACSAASPVNSAASAVESYLQSLVRRDLNGAVNASCAAWEEQARLEYNSFEAVKLELQDVQCKETGQDSPYTLVACTGTIVANYGNEDLQIDVADRSYQVIQEGGEWKMCGYHP